MRKIFTLTFLLLILIFSTNFAQTFDGEWSVDYVTSDSPDSANSIGQRVISVTTIEENSFVALVNRGSANAYYLVGFRNAGINQGRLGTYPYPASDFQTKWIDFFSQEFVFDANDLASKGNFIYVANNEAPNHSVLVFEFKEDSIYSYPQRFSLGEYIWGIDIDGSGRVYVTKTGDSLNAGSVVVIDNPDNAPAWSAGGNTGTILTEFTLPDIGQPRGITVNNDGTIIYVSNYDENKVYCFVGDPINGYSLYDGFNFTVDSEFQTSGALISVGPFGLQLMPDKNLLFVTHDANFSGGDAYEYGRIYIANPNTGEVLDTVNIAEWNFSVEGQYDNHNPENKASGYASNYAVDFDEKYNLYSSCWRGWTAEKWVYSGELPTIEILITSIEKSSSKIPDNFSLEQNYPNPFNPSTTIKFNLNKAQNISLSIYDINGQLITDLIKSSDFSAGSYKITFDASNLSSGTYIYRLRTQNNVIAKKMTLLK